MRWLEHREAYEALQNLRRGGRVERGPARASSRAGWVKKGITRKKTPPKQTRRTLTD